MKKLRSAVVCLPPLAALAALFCFPAAVAANDIAPGVFGQHVPAVAQFLTDPTGQVQIVSTTITAPGVAQSCPGVVPETAHFGIATGFEERNGFVLSNGYVEDIDNDGGALGFNGNCISSAGDVFPPGSDCISYSSALAGLLAGVPNEDTVILSVDLQAAQATTITISYNFLTFEDPNNASFYDAFAIALDNNLLAGGTTNGGPMGGTDPWNLSASSGVIYEYQSIAPSGNHLLPGRETGRRNLEVTIPAGAHTLDFYVADSGPNAICGFGACPLVHSALFLGLHTFQGASATSSGSAVPGLNPTIEPVGHASASFGQGGSFPADFGVTLSGAQPGALVFFLQGNGILPGISVPLIAPRGLMVGPSLVITPLTTDTNGQAIFPPTPPVLNSSVHGLRIHFQWMGLDGGGVFSTPGLRVDFGA